MTLLATPKLMAPDTIETIRKNGGGTFDKNGEPAKHEDGYYVATHPLICGWYSLDDIFREIPFHFWPVDYPDLLGFWQADDGYWYVDFVVHYPAGEYDEAVKAAIENNEISIFDIQEKIAVYVTGRGTTFND